MLWLENALQEESLAQERSFNLSQSEPNHTSSQPAPNQQISREESFVETTTKENSIEFYQEPSSLSHNSDSDLSILTPVGLVCPGKQGKKSARKSKKRINKIEDKADDTEKNFALEYVLHLPAEVKEKNKTTCGSHKRRFPGPVAAPEKFVKFESKTGKLLFKWNLNNQSLTALKEEVFLVVGTADQLTLAAHAEEKEDEMVLEWYGGIPHHGDITATLRRREEQKKQSGLSGLIEAHSATEERSPTNGAVWSHKFLTNFALLKMTHQPNKSLSKPHELNVYINPKEINQYLPLNNDMLHLWARAMTANPGQVNKYNPPPSPLFQKFLTKGSAQEIKSSETAQASSNNTHIPAQRLPANTSTPTSQNTPGTVSDLVNTPIAGMNFGQLLSLVASANNSGLLNPIPQGFAAQLTPYPMAAHLGQHLNLPATPALNATPQKSLGEVPLSPAPSDTTSIEDYL
ncbi:hypothetical protein MJO28_009627 [Puccinia striiformis f. sp. tritici]|uniref:Uncharacterized protein n=2 Tax=Puccinia striiformis f. sp. tritici TaxID=168172 RepID=A0A0L0V5Y1_9BASI|nr:hypothetical protein MJO28_009627 [Puccinia striiformis f. sp. tritici]KAI7950752.1 hypothetical protein MJO29_009426 [Puccinia striiformis f. sp. tritici]KNE94710.1 hypothetical protein PSTG_11898 [Puccinia striiformis f. sp. tritici PST-78]